MLCTEVKKRKLLEKFIALGMCLDGMKGTTDLLLGSRVKKKNRRQIDCTKSSSSSSVSVSASTIRLQASSIFPSFTQSAVQSIRNPDVSHLSTHRVPAAVQTGIPQVAVAAKYFWYQGFAVPAEPST